MKNLITDPLLKLEDDDWDQDDDEDDSFDDGDDE